MSLAGVIADFKTGTYTVTRKGAGTYDATGAHVPAATSTFSIDACVQPVSGKVLQNLPEGHHANETKAIWTTTALRTRDAAGAPDIIAIGGENYTVFHVEVFEAFGGDGEGDHYMVLATRGALP